MGDRLNFALSRRTVLGVGLALPALRFVPDAGALSPVVTIHDDRAWLDHTGRAKAYRPPVSHAYAYAPETLDQHVYR